MNYLFKYLPVAYFSVILFPMLAGAESFLSKNSIFSISIGYPAFFLLLALLIPVLLRILLNHKGQELAGVYINTVWITVPFLIVALVSTIWGIHPGAYWEDGPKIILLDLYHWIILMFSVAIAYSWTIRKYNHIIFFGILAAACYGIWIDLVSPGSFSVLGHRAAGFTSNSNWGGRIIILLAIAAIDWKKNNSLNLVTLIISGLAVFATLSVANLALYLSVVIFYLILNLKGDGHTLRKFVLIAAVPLLIFYVIHPLILNIISNSEMFDNRTSTERMEQISEMFQGDMTFAEDHERKNLAYEYWTYIQTAPVLGLGTGFSRSQVLGPHNMYLKHWVENGLPGLFVYLFLIGCSFRHFAILKDTRGMVFVFIFFWAGFFDHNLLNYKTIVILLGMFGTLAYLDKSRQPAISNSKTKLPI